MMVDVPHPSTSEGETGGWGAEATQHTQGQQALHESHLRQRLYRHWYGLVASSEALLPVLCGRVHPCRLYPTDVCISLDGTEAKRIQSPLTDCRTVVEQVGISP